jgi:hypothetical protein
MHVPSASAAARACSGVMPCCRAKFWNDERRGWGVSLRCAPGRASRAVGNETTVANGAEPPARQASPRTWNIGAGAPVSRPFGRESLTRIVAFRTPSAAPPTAGPILKDAVKPGIARRATPAATDTSAVPIRMENGPDGARAAWHWVHGCDAPLLVRPGGPRCRCGGRATSRSQGYRPGNNGEIARWCILRTPHGAHDGDRDLLSFLWMFPSRHNLDPSSDRSLRKAQA